MRKSKTILKFQVTLEAPKGATIPDVQAYISKALVSHQDDFLSDTKFKLNDESVRVSLIERKTTYA